jgi:hypothetical protein
VVVPSVALGAWIFRGDETSFIRSAAKESLGGGFLPFDATLAGSLPHMPPTQLDRVLNVEADFGHVLQAARETGYRITHHHPYAIGERGSNESRLFFVAGRAYVQKGSDYESGNAKGRTVVGVEYRPTLIRHVAQRFGFARSPGSNLYRFVFDPIYLPQWGTP